MKLQSIQLENFRAFERLSFSLGERVTLLIGENGSGKTSILDAIGIGLGAILTHLPDVKGLTFKKTDLRSQHVQKAPYMRVALQTTERLAWDRMVKRDKSQLTAKQLTQTLGLKKLEHYLYAKVIETAVMSLDYTLPLFVSYGVSRAILDLPLRRKGNSFHKKYQRIDALADALNADSRFKSAFVWFYNKELEEQRLQKERRSFDVTLSELDAVRSAITQMFPDLTEPHIEVNPLQFVVKQNEQFLNIDQLSDGYKTLLGLVIDLSARMAMANPNSPNPLAEQAIVMIDEVDLHLHPAWQKRVVSDLLRTFPNTQFILTTHSPYIVESINNSLKLAQVTQTLQDQNLQDRYPQLALLKREHTEAYWIHNAQATSILDNEIGLLDDKLITYWNEINAVYDELRDIEWEAAHD